MTVLRLIIEKRFGAAILAGLLLASAFPNAIFKNVGVAGFAWIAPGLILFSAMGLIGKKAFRMGYVAGLAHYLVSLYWLLLIPVPWTWAWAKALGWLALAAYLALYPATWVWLCWKIYPAKYEGPFSLKSWAVHYLSVSWSRRLAWTLSGAALWVALEMVVARLLGGFPWNLLGNSQYKILPLIQIASVTGVYGLSFLAVWFSMSLMSALMLLTRPGTARSMLFAEIIVPMLAAAIVFAVGYERILRPIRIEGARETRTLSVALVQPSIPQTVKWDESKSDYQFEQLIKLSREALTNKPDLLVWPESAVPKMVRWDKETSDAICGLARSNKVWMIIGSDDFEPHPGAKTFHDGEYYNSSFLVSPQGELVAKYKKQNLVIFGEYIPLVKYLPFLKYLTPIGPEGFSAGDRAVSFNLRLQGKDAKQFEAKTSVLICYEDMFPQLARKYVDDDTDFLVNLTNDGWFGEGAEQWQHAAGGVLRAVENGVPLVRCCNNGLTCWIDAQGRMRQSFVSDSHGIYGPGYLIATIPLRAPDEHGRTTIYRMSYDAFGWGCVAWALLQVIARWFRRL
jgi:apolipoprotein N-acyltransferase